MNMDHAFCGLPEGAYWRTILMCVMKLQPDCELNISLQQLDAFLTDKGAACIRVERTDAGVRIKLVSGQEAEFLLSQQQGLTN